jgi:hypothetical protein
MAHLNIITRTFLHILNSSPIMDIHLPLAMLHISGLTLPTRCRLRLLIPVLGSSLKQFLFKQVSSHIPHRLLSLNNVAAYLEVPRQRMARLKWKKMRIFEFHFQVCPEFVFFLFLF